MKSKLLICLILILPSSAGAAVRLNEVMYDVEGSDTGREWVEILNDSSGTVDVSQFKLFEANTNHGLTLVAGNPILSPQGVAVIADNATKFMLDWPSFTGTLFESSFSLSNSGETLGIKNGALVEEDTISYTSEQGAQGDGKALQRSGAVFIAGTATPGTHQTQSSSFSASSQEDESEESGTISSPNSGGGEVARITAYAGEDRSVIVGADVLFEGEGYGIEGAPLLNARYVWSFGDGSSAEGKRAVHRYSYPGRYVIMLSLTSGDYSATDRMLLEASPARLMVRGETDGSVSVFNKGASDVDLGRWILTRGGVSFIIPLDTIVLAGEGIRISSGLTGFSGGGSTDLLYPSGALAVAEGEMSGQDLGERGLIERIPLETVSLPRQKVVPAVLGTAVEEESQPVEVSSVTEEKSGAPEQSIFPWLGALAGIIAIGTVGVWYSRRLPEGEETIQSLAAQFQITDISEKEDTK